MPRSRRVRAAQVASVGHAFSQRHRASCDDDTHGRSTAGARTSTCELRLALHFGAHVQGGYNWYLTRTPNQHSIHFVHTPCLTGFGIAARADVFSSLRLFASPAVQLSDRSSKLRRRAAHPFEWPWLRPAYPQQNAVLTLDAVGSVPQIKSAMSTLVACRRHPSTVSPSSRARCCNLCWICCVSIGALSL